ncbi:MAG: carbon-nitrogen hydrolase family protein [Planctomycetota bacterium]
MNQRRNFLKASAIGASALGLSGSAFAMNAAPAKPTPPKPKEKRLPREVWVATVSAAGLRADNSEKMLEQTLELMEETAACAPDIICLTETFPVANIAKRPPLQEAAAVWWEKVLPRFSDFANENNCYLVCPLHTEEKGSVYNSAAFLDRSGQLLGRYHKIHTTTDESGRGVVAGPLDAPVFETDFGIVGAQICFDIEWRDGWEKLAEKNAEIVFWPSAFGGGKMVNTRAWEHQYAVVSSTRKSPSKICDLDGTQLAVTSHWNDWVCAPINLEKAFLHTWPFVKRFPEIQAKYGKEIRITNHADEEWSILESLSADLRIADVMKEFELVSLREHLAEAEKVQCSCRVN